MFKFQRTIYDVRDIPLLFEDLFEYIKKLEKENEELKDDNEYLSEIIARHDLF